MVRILGSPGRSRRLRVGVALAACTALVMLMAVPAQAVHDLEFQLDGNIADDAAAAQDWDWASFFNAAGQRDPILPDASRPDFDASGFDRDFITNSNGSFNTSDQSTFATGSKDTLPITPGWQCNQDNNVNSKTDVMNAYAVSYVVPNTHPDPAMRGDEILYFALERNANTGTGNVGFWFLQDGTVDCVSPGTTTAFTGEHRTGDVLVVSEFSQGGTVSTIVAYQWVGGPTGGIDPNPIAQGVSCSGTAGGDEICAQVNTGTISNIPWLTANKQDGVGHSLRVSEFFEGGINLTDSGLGGKCFNVFIGDTRSSTSLTATIFDFSRGLLGGCVSDTTTTPQTGAGDPIPAGGLSIGTGSVTVRDRAVIDVTGSETFGGTVDFSLCGPLATSTTSNCQTGGAAISTETVTGAAGTATVFSDVTTLTSAGRYCWRAEYSGDATAGVPESSDPDDATNLSECFVVNPVTPTLTTAAGADVVLGQPITDTATLSGTANQPGTGGLGGAETIAPGSINPTTPGAAANGSISWTVRGPNNCTASGLTVNGSPATVSGDNTYGPVNATPTQIGTYTFVATYTGDSPNTLGAAGTCPAAAGQDEEVTVGGSASLSTAQRWLPNDTAHITSQAGTTLSGNVTFTLYNDATCGAGTGTQQYTSGAIDVTTGTGSANDRTVSTNNTTFLVTIDNDTTAWSWKVHYDDTNLQDPTDKCESTTAFTLTDA